MKTMRVSYLGGEVSIPEKPIVPVIDLWNDINTYCRTKATPEQCQALLGNNPLYLPLTCKSKTPFWAWMLIGFAISRISHV